MSNRLHNIFSSLQEHLEADLKAGQTVFAHPVAKGDLTEFNWLKTLKEHLPQRYQATKGFIIDSHGNESEQIDLVIYDWQYTPVLYNKDEQRMIPAESVYAVFEIKQNLNSEHIEYAGNKIASVRKLHRTSTEIHHAGGVYQPRPLPQILGGILTYKSDWKSDYCKRLTSSLAKLDINSQLNLGCIITEGAFEAKYGGENQVDLFLSNPKLSLITFIFRLLANLKNAGTVPAIDYDAYSRSFVNQC